MTVAYHKQPGAVGNIVATFSGAEESGFNGCPVVYEGQAEGYSWFRSLDPERYRWDPYGRGVNEGFVWNLEDVEWAE